MDSPSRVFHAGIRDVEFGERVTVVEPVNLYECFIADDALKVAHHLWEGVWSNHGANRIKIILRIFKVGFEGAIDCVFEGSGATSN